MIGWFGTAMLCYVTPKEHLGLPDRDDVKAGVIAYQASPRMRPISPRAIRRRAIWDDAMSQGALRIPLARPVRLALDPETARELPRRDPAGRRRQGRAFLLDVRPEILLDEDLAGSARIRAAGHGRRRAAPSARRAARSTRCWKARPSRSTRERPDLALLPRPALRRLRSPCAAAASVFCWRGARWAPGIGRWGFPGGMQELGETIATARRARAAGGNRHRGRAAADHRRLQRHRPRRAGPGPRPFHA